MSKHVTYRGVTIDMETLRRENEKAVAIGNMKVNARGDQINRGVVTKTADEIARENHRVKSAVMNTSIKGPQPASPSPVLEQPKTAKPAPVAKKVEKELPSGDIVMEDEPTKE